MSDLVISAVLGATTVASSIYAWRLRKQNKYLQKEVANLYRSKDFKNCFSNQDIFIKIDKDFKITNINETALNLIGLDDNEIKNKSIFGTLLADNNSNRVKLKNIYEQILKFKKSVNFDQIILTQDKEDMLVKCHHAPILDALGNVKGISLLCKDISVTNTLKEQLNIITSIDPLTESLNQTSFFEKFEHEYKLALRYNKECSLIMVELHDLLKFVNNGIDYRTGDNTLKTAAKICTENSTSHDYIGRIDGTKICLILPDTTIEKALKISEKIYNKLTKEIHEQGIDLSHSEMIYIGCTSRSHMDSTYDIMIQRVKRSVKYALDKKRYGVCNSNQSKSKKPIKEYSNPSKITSFKKGNIITENIDVSE